MRKTLVILTVILTIACLVLGDVFWGKIKLLAEKESILDLQIGDVGTIRKGIFAANLAGEDHIGFIDPPILFPFGSWSMLRNGDVVWLTKAQIESIISLK